MNRTALVAAVALPVASVACFCSVGCPVLEPFAPGEVTIGPGVVKDRLDVCASNILRHLAVEKSFVQPFVKRDTTDAWRFVGCGMLLDSLVKASAHGIGGKEMTALKDRVLGEILASQSGDGRISIFADAKKIGKWDNHDQAYFLQALCHEWEWTRNAAALAAAKRLGDYLVARNSPVNLGLETGFVMLYRTAGDGRYRDHLERRFGMGGGMENYARLLRDEGGIPHGVPLKHVYSWEARSLAEYQFGEAIGSKDGKYTEPMEELWRRAFTPATSISGTMSGPTHEDWPGWGEKWTETNAGKGVWGETCVSAYLMRALQFMFTHRAEPRFGDLYERVMYNAFFAAMSKDGINYRYFTPFEEKGVWYHEETYCCPNNFRREIFEIPDAVFFHIGERELAVNLAMPATLQTKALEVEMSTRYPEDGRVTLSVKRGAVDAVWLRIPGWCTNATVKCGGEVLRPKAGSWTKVRMEKSLEFEFPIEERMVKGQRMQEGRSARMKGPVVFGYDAKGGVVKFADESRVTTYRSTDIPVRAVDDELLSPERWRKLKAPEKPEKVAISLTGRNWWTWSDDGVCVLETMGCEPEAWKRVLVADPNGGNSVGYEGNREVKYADPKVEITDDGRCRWSWTELNGAAVRRVGIAFPADAEYPMVTKDQAVRCDIIER